MHVFNYSCIVKTKFYIIKYNENTDTQNDSCITGRSLVRVLGKPCISVAFS